MELKDLNDDERLALVAILELVLDADAQMSDEEMDKLDAVAAELGDDVYDATVDEVDRRFAGEESLRAFLPTILRPEARELIYGTVLDAAISDTVDSSEGDFLDWLAQTWNISVETEAPEADAAE